MTTPKINVVSHRVDGIRSTAEVSPADLYSSTAMPRWFSNGSVAAAGSAQGDGTVLSPGVTIVSGADGTKGVTLTAPNADQQGGEIYFIKNTAGSTLKIYPPTSGTINALSANANYVLATVTSCLLVNVWADKTITGGQWYSLPLLAS
jgi:hypothetical protein